MESTDLMIKDWVLHEKKPYMIRQLGIYGEDRDGEDYPAMCIGKEHGIGLIVERKEIEPIPITKEILEKNGFERQQGYIGFVFAFDDDDKDAHVIIHPKEDNYTRGAYTYIHIEHGCLSLDELPIEYIHELQHALRLCKIDKEIVL